MPLDWDNLRFFLGVARSGRLTAAARNLKVDHATCSRRIAALEASLACKLFERRPQGYSLTADGEKLVAIAETMESQALAAQGAVGGMNLNLSGVVRLGAPDGFSTYFLAPRLAGLMRKHRDLTIELVSTPQLLSLTKREADIAISLNRPKGGKVVARKLTDYDLSLFAARSYLEQAKPIRRRDDLLHHPIIGYVEDLVVAPELNYLGEITRGLKARFQSSNLIAQMTATIAGNGLCILPHFIASQEPRLTHVLPGAISLRRSFWLTVHEDMRNLSRIRVILDLLQDEIKRHRRLFLPG